MNRQKLTFCRTLLASVFLGGLTILPTSAAPAANGIKFRVSTALSEGCALDPSGMGCPLTVIKLVSVGDPVHVLGIVINRRYKTPECNVKIDKTFDVGDSWTSDRGDIRQHPLWYDFTRYCGKQAVQVDVFTDKGMIPFNFGG